MRRFGLLLALLLLSLALPSAARADTGWSLESPTLRRSAPVREAAEAKLAPAGRSGPLTLFAALGSTPKAVVERGERETRPPGEAPLRRFERPDHTLPQIAARSRVRAARLDSLRAMPAVARATRGVVGFHASPAPPLS